LLVKRGDFGNANWTVEHCWLIAPSKYFVIDFAASISRIFMSEKQEMSGNHENLAVSNDHLDDDTTDRGKKHDFGDMNFEAAVRLSKSTKLHRNCCIWASELYVHVLMHISLLLTFCRGLHDRVQSDEEDHGHRSEDLDFSSIEVGAFSFSKFHGSAQTMTV
jgi:hypothetical protein